MYGLPGLNHGKVLYTEAMAGLRLDRAISAI